MTDDDINKMFENVINKMKTYHPSNDFSALRNVYEFIKRAHGDQKRKSGEPYIIHPLSVAQILADLELDKETIIAGMLHDVVEDTVYTQEQISDFFTDEVGSLVDGVTKLKKISYSTKEEVQAENFRKMFLAMAKDIRVILIKLADRLHNMRTLEYMSPHKQHDIAQETIDIYAPLAKRLGISKIQTELEDLSLKYINPEVYYELANKIEKKQVVRNEFVQEICSSIREELDSNGVTASVEGRPKHFFSIYKKMVNQDKTLDQIFDLFAVRVIVDTVQDCYTVLGIVDGMYKPVPGRFKNYIATPKSNNYQSLHDTLIGSSGEPFELQIRTWEMHRTSEYGIAAHWKYKAGKSGEVTADNVDAKLNWLRQILEWQRDLSDNKEFMEAIKTDLNVYSDQVYVFSPKGDIINLQKGSTPVDFAYMIHTAVGNKMVGAKVNGKIVPIEYQVKNGDRIEIMTSQNSSGPSRDWLKIVKTQQAKSKINQWFKNEFKEENIFRGKEILEREIRKKGYAVSDLMHPEWMATVTNKYGFGNWDAVCAAIGHGGLKEGHVLNRLIDEYEKKAEKSLTTEDILRRIEEEAVQKPPKVGKSGVVIQGVGDVPVRFSRCCNPVPGDEIIGFVTRGRGVSIHRTDCINIINTSEDERNRLLEAEWNVRIKDNVSFSAEIKIICDDRMAILADISRVFADSNSPVKSMNARSTKNNEAVFDVVLEVTSKPQLEKLTGRILSIKGVHEIVRVST